MEPCHQLRLRFRQIEGRAIGLGDAAQEVDHEREEQGGIHDEPRVLLLLHDARQAERSGHHDHGHERDPLRQLVGDHLRRGAQPPEQRVLGIAGPSAEHDSVHPHRRRAQDPEDRDVHVGDLERDVVPRDVDGVPEGHHGQGQERGDHGERGRDDEDDAVGAGRDDVLLEEELDPVGDRLEEPEGTHPLRADPILHVADHLSLHPDDERNAEQHESEDDQNLDRGCDQKRGVHAATSDLPGGDRAAEA